MKVTGAPSRRERRMPDPFPSTQWSVVLRAGEGHRASLAALCETYWPPLYAYARRRGMGREDAQDAVQGFLTRFLERGDLQRVHPERGRFRAYLLASLKHHLVRQHEARTAQKRGGGVVPLSIEWARAEGLVGIEPVETETAENLFERQWALLLMERARGQVADHYEQRGQSTLWTAIGGLLHGDGVGRYQDIATALDMSVSAVKVAVHRMRKRFREAVEREVAATVEDLREVEDEVEYLYRILGDR